jgi:hypothetical protein
LGIGYPPQYLYLFPLFMATKKLLWLLPLTIVLYACPYESAVPLEQHPVETTDSSLYGYWYGIVKDGSDFFGIEALDITKDSDSTYNIIRYGKAAKGDIILPDTAYFTGYISYIGGQRYMNIVTDIVTVETKRNSKVPDVKTQRVYYIAAFNMRHDTLDVKTITEDFTPSSRKGYKTPGQLKELVDTMTKQKKNIYDDLYTLSYRKIQKPKPLKPF